MIHSHFLALFKYMNLIIKKIGCQAFRMNNLNPSGLVTVVRDLLPAFTGKEVPQMLTIEGLIAVISLVLTAFGLGYAIGRNAETRE